MLQKIVIKLFDSTYINSTRFHLKRGFHPIVKTSSPNSGIVSTKWRKSLPGAWQQWYNCSCTAPAVVNIPTTCCVYSLCCCVALTTGLSHDLWTLCLENGRVELLGSGLFCRNFAKKLFFFSDKKFKTTKFYFSQKISIQPNFSENIFVPIHMRGGWSGG